MKMNNILNNDIKFWMILVSIIFSTVNVLFISPSY